MFRSQQTWNKLTAGLSAGSTAYNTSWQKTGCRGCPGRTGGWERCARRPGWLKSCLDLFLLIFLTTEVLLSSSFSPLIFRFLFTSPRKTSELNFLLESSTSPKLSGLDPPTLINRWYSLRHNKSSALQTVWALLYFLSNRTQIKGKTSCPASLFYINGKITES